MQPITHAARIASWRTPWVRGLFGVATLAVSTAPGAGAQLRNFTHFEAKEGLPQAQVRAVMQDSRSYLWVGTYGGLSRFDGVSFKTYTQRDGLSANAVLAIAEDASGRIVVGILGGGVCVQRVGGFRCIGTEDGLPGLDVRDLETTPDGGIWVATERGVAFVDSTGAARSYPVSGGNERHSHVTRLARDADGTLWVGTDGGLLRLIDDRLVAVAEPLLMDQPVRFILPVDGGILIGTPSRLLRRTNGRFETLPGTKPAVGAEYTDASLDRSGSIWISTLKGVLRYDGRQLDRFTAHEGLLEDETNAVMVDREGDVWFATESGLSKLTPGPFDHFTPREGLPNPFVRALAQDDEGTLWAGTRDGVAKRLGDRFVDVPLEGVTAPRVFGIAALPGHGLLIGTRTGLIHFDRGVRRAYGIGDGLPSLFVLSVHGDGQGGAWVGTDRGIVRWRAGRIIPAQDSLLSSTIAVAMAHDRRGRLWVGARSGGVLIHDSLGTASLGRAEGLSDETVWSLASDDVGMWVGTNGDGAFHVASDGAIRQLRTAEGLPNDFVWQVLADRSGAVWFSTNRGLARYHGGHAQSYGHADGLIDLEGTANAALEDQQGVLWFGTSSGVTRYRRQLDVESTTPPPIYIDGATVGARALVAGDMRLRQRDGVLRIRFSSPSLRDPQGLRFRYRLAGSDDAWSELTSDRIAAYARLSPGQHEFEVQALTSNGIASATTARLRFTVLPLFWQTWWFRLLGVIALGAAAASIPYHRSLKHQRERDQLELVVGQRTDDLRAQATRLEREVADRRLAEQRLRDIVEHSTNTFYSHTREHELTYVSPQSMQFFGLAPDEALVRWTELLTDNEANAAGFAATQRAIDTGEKQPPYELELRHVDGRRVWVQVNEAPVVRDGRTHSMVGSLTDITEAKLAREKEEQLQGQLRQAQKMEAIGRLAGGIAHDFNNLLTSVIGNTELIASQVEPESPLHVDLDEIRRASDRAAGLVAQLLAFSRQQLVQRRVLDVNVVVAEAGRMLQRLVGSDIKLELRLMGEPGWVLADHGQLDQVLLNLAANARDALSAGGCICITTEAIRADLPLDADTPAGDYVRITVRDSGVGMSAETIARVFEPFFTTKELGRGTGLGLAMVYGIAKQNDGHVTIESEPGQGTAVRLYLRVAPPPVAPVVEAASADLPDARGDERVILVVEDDAAIRKLACRSLRTRGYHVLDAPDGSAAVAVSDTYRGRIDLVLTDVIMPGMNGKQVATHIAQRRPETRVLFMSGHAQDTLGARGMIAEDSTLLIQKPFALRELLRRVQEVLDAG